MKKRIGTLCRLALSYSCILTLLLIFQAPSHAQEGSYSTMAQRVLDTQNAFNADNTSSIDVFKFSVNDILNSLGETVENPSGTPKIFGRTDYGSEFSLANDLALPLISKFLHL